MHSRDRTSQLTALTQLMLDPYYRTIDGFLTIIHKEFCAFGHKFEDRLGRSHSSKEISPIFVQFLDSVWQLLSQYPTKFEFTSYMLVLILQCVYSGIFISFRGNCERDRVLLARRNAAYEDMSNDDFEFSNLSFFINLLLRTPSHMIMVLNPNYVPPTPDEKKVSCEIVCQV